MDPTLKANLLGILDTNILRFVQSHPRKATDALKRALVSEFDTKGKQRFFILGYSKHSFPREPKIHEIRKLKPRLLPELWL